MTEDEIRDYLQNNSPLDSYNKLLLGNDVWYFKDYLQTTDYSGHYDEFRRFVSGKLNIQFNNIAIFGSAKIGLSLSPTQLFKPFNDKSDIDIAIISSDRFYMFWKAYMKMHHNLETIDNYNYVTKCIFQRFIYLDSIPPTNTTFIKWDKQVNGLIKDLQLIYNIKHPINYRIFESWDAAQGYYTRGLALAKDKLMEVVSCPQKSLIK